MYKFTQKEIDQNLNIPGIYKISNTIDEIFYTFICECGRQISGQGNFNQHQKACKKKYENKS